MNLIPNHAPKFFAKTALALAISTVLWSSTVTAAGWNEEDPQPLIDTYYQSGYNYCDAMALSMWWYGSEDDEAVYDSKLRGGWKFAAGDDLRLIILNRKLKLLQATTHCHNTSNFQAATMTNQVMATKMHKPLHASGIHQ